MKVNRRLIKKILSVVLAVAMTIGTVNLQPFVSEVKAATTIKFVGNSDVANDNARVYVMGRYQIHLRTGTAIMR